MDKQYKIAVYGTLKRGGGLHKHLESSEFIKTDKVRGELYGYEIKGEVCIPMLTDGESLIEVEIYNVDERTFAILNGIELNAGYHIYLLETESGETVYVWRYFKDQVQGLTKIDKFPVTTE